MLLVRLKYDGEKYAQSTAIVRYYDKDGDFIKNSSYSSCHGKGDISTYVFDLPRNSMGEKLDYTTFKIAISASGANGTSYKDQLEIGESSSFVKEYEYENSESYYCTIPITNKGKTEVQSGDCVVILWRGDEPIAVNSLHLSGIAGNETVERRVYWRWNRSEGVDQNTRVVPDGITIEYNYARINSGD